MDWLSSGLGILKNGLGIVFSWMTGYGSKQNTEARVKNDETAKKDEFHKNIEDNNIEEERKKLS